jgi:hypothetical protein
MNNEKSAFPVFDSAKERLMDAGSEGITLWQ